MAQALGLLRTGHLIEADRAALVAGSGFSQANLFKAQSLENRRECFLAKFLNLSIYSESLQSLFSFDF